MGISGIGQNPLRRDLGCKILNSLGRFSLEKTELPACHVCIDIPEEVFLWVQQSYRYSEAAVVMLQGDLIITETGGRSKHCPCGTAFAGVIESLKLNSDFKGKLVKADKVYQCQTSHREPPRMQFLEL